MKWIVSTLEAGDHIRVKRNYYYHHGIYVGNNKVIHYTAINDDGIINPESVKVRLTDLSFFLKGGIVEKATYSALERKNVYPSETIIKNAYTHLNEGNYNFFNHNCEDLAIICTHPDPKKVNTQIRTLKEKVIGVFKK